MGDVYKGLTIEFGAATTGLDAALKDINKQAAAAGKELGNVNRLLKFDPRNTELLGQKQTVLAQRIAATKQRLEALKQAQAQVDAMYKSGEIDAGAYRHFQRQIINSELELKKLESQGKITARELEAAAIKAGKSMETFGGKVTSVGKTGMATVTAPIIAAGVAAEVLGMNFEQSMNQVQAATEAPADQMERLNALALKLGADTVFSAGDAASAMLELAKAGISPAQIEAGALDATLRLAAAGGIELSAAATVTANALNMFDLQASDANDVANALAGGANRSSASVDSLQQALAQVGPGAKNANLSLNDTVGVLAAFADRGIQGSDAGTSLKTMLQRLVPQTDAEAKAMEALGLKFTDAHGRFLPISQIAGQLQDKLKGLTQEQRAQALQTIFGSDATRAATVLMEEGTKGIQDYIDATMDQTAAQDMADSRMKGATGAVENMRGSLESAAIEASDTLEPAVISLSGVVKGLADSFAGASKSDQQLIIEFAALAAAIPVALVALGWLITAIGNVVTAWGTLATAITNAGGILALLSNPIGLVLVILAELVAIFLILNARMNEARTASANAALGVRNLGLDSDITRASLGRTSDVVRQYAIAADASAAASDRAAAGIEAVKYASEQARGAHAQLVKEVQHNTEVHHQLESASLSVARAQKNVDGLRNSGKTDTLEYKEAVNQLALANDELRRRQDEVATSDNRVNQAERAEAEAARLRQTTIERTNTAMQQMASQGLTQLSVAQATANSGVRASQYELLAQQTAVNNSTVALGKLGIKWAGTGQAIYDANGRLTGWNQTPSKDKKPNTTFVPVKQAIDDANHAIDTYNAKKINPKHATITFTVEQQTRVFGSAIYPPGKATGGFFTSPTAIVIGDGNQSPGEWAISTDPRYHEQNLAYWRAAGEALGAFSDPERLNPSRSMSPVSAAPAAAQTPNVTIPLTVEIGGEKLDQRIVRVSTHGVASGLGAPVVGI